MVPVTVSVYVREVGAHPPLNETPPNDTVSMGNPSGTCTSVVGHVNTKGGTGVVVTGTVVTVVGGNVVVCTVNVTVLLKSGSVPL
jgi:hypothetical protein